MEKRKVEKGSTVDIVYLWVNSTDPLFPTSYRARMLEEELEVDEGQARRWRDNGELRGAVRSSVQSLGEDLRKVHIISADYRPRSESEKIDRHSLDHNHDHHRDTQTSHASRAEQGENGQGVVELFGEGTVGQIPGWLDWEAQEEGREDMVNWHFHSDIFRLPRFQDGHLLVDEQVLGAYELVSPPASESRSTASDLEPTPADSDSNPRSDSIIDGIARKGQEEMEVERENLLETAWRELALPSFNSFAIESRVGWITGLSETL